MIGSDDDELPFEPHPLVALPRPVHPDAFPLPSPRGATPKSGTMSAASLARTRAIAEALFSPDDATPPPAERLDWVMDEYADLMARTTGRGRFLFTLAALAVTTISPWLTRGPRRFVQAPLTARVVMLRALEDSPLAGILIALRALLCILYYEHPDAARSAGIWLGPGSRR